MWQNWTERLSFIISYILTLGFGIEESGRVATVAIDPGQTGQGIRERLAAKIFRFYETHGSTRLYTSRRWDSTDLLSFFRTLYFAKGAIL